MRQVVSRAARHADALIAVTAGRARRDRRRARARPAAVQRRAPRRDAPGPPRPPRPRREVRERLRPRRPPRGAVRGREAPAQEPGAAGPRGRAAARRRGGRARRPPRALRRASCARLAAGLGVDGSVVLRGLRAATTSSRGSGGSPACAAFPTRAEGFGMPVLEALRARRARWRARTCRCCARSAATSPATSTPTTRRTRLASDRRRRSPLPRPLPGAGEWAARFTLGRGGRRAPGRPTTGRSPADAARGPQPRLPDPGRDRRDGDGRAGDDPAASPRIDDLRLTLFVNREAAGTFGGVAEEVVVPVNAAQPVQWVRGEQQHIPRLARPPRVRDRALTRVDRAAARAPSSA